MNPVFLDTGYVIALEAADDQYHEEAIKHWRDVLRNVPTLVTTTYVINVNRLCTKTILPGSNTATNIVQLNGRWIPGGHHEDLK